MAFGAKSRRPAAAERPFDTHLAEVLGSGAGHARLVVPSPSRARSVGVRSVQFLSFTPAVLHDLVPAHAAPLVPRGAVRGSPPPPGHNNALPVSTVAARTHGRADGRTDGRTDERRRQNAD